MTLAQTRFPHHFFFSPALQLSSPACFVLDLPDSLSDNACLGSDESVNLENY
jgi:hypothetical protein